MQQVRFLSVANSSEPIKNQFEIGTESQLQKCFRLLAFFMNDLLKPLSTFDSLTHSSWSELQELSCLKKPFRHSSDELASAAYKKMHQWIR